MENENIVNENVQSSEEAVNVEVAGEEAVNGEDIAEGEQSA